MATETFKQESHKLLVIPGPIEVPDEVLYSNAHPSVSHMSPDFSSVLGDCLKMLNPVVGMTEPTGIEGGGQGFIIAGSGTLGWDMISANLVEAGEEAVLLNTGYFGDSFADCLETYGAKVTQLYAPSNTPGDRPTMDDLAKLLQTKKFKIVCFTHVDTSTGVLSDAKAIGETVRRVSPDTLVAMDGVCSVASEEIKMTEWGIDAIMTGSQKGISCPAGLSLVVASARAIKTLETRKTPVPSYFASWKKWLPVMRAYENSQVAYFGTPPVQLIYALQTSLKQITAGTVLLPERLALHKQASRKLKNEALNLGFKLVPFDIEASANGMTAIYSHPYKPTDIVPRFLSRGIVVAAGIHKDIKTSYFRIGHMGPSVVDKSRDDLDRVIAALREIVQELQIQGKQ